MPTTILKTSDGRLDASDEERFDTLRARLGNGPRTVLLHLHGGLVNRKAGQAAARRLSGQGPQSFNAPADFEQVYVVWRTGVFETLRANWKDLFENDRLYRSLFRRILQFVYRRVELPDLPGRSLATAVTLTDREIEDRLKSGDDAPFADLDEALGAQQVGRSYTVSDVDELGADDELRLMLSTDPEFQAAIDALAAAMAPDSEARSLAGFSAAQAEEGRRLLVHLDSRIATELQAEAAEDAEDGGRGLVSSFLLARAFFRHGRRIASRIIRRMRNGRHHGFHATLVEELVREIYGDFIGASIWGMMKQDARDHFRNGGLGKRLVDELAGSGHRVIVVGHSAGAIWAREFLRAAARAASFPRIELNLLAPAIRVSDFTDALDEAAPLLDHFRIFTMKDSLERQDPVLGPGWGKVYPSSLLYVISGILEEREARAYVDAPILGMQRFIDRAPDWIGEAEERTAIALARSFLDTRDNTLVYSVVDGGAGLSSSAMAHAAFDDDPATLASIAASFVKDGDA